MVTSTERLHFKIGLSANYWAKIPKYSVIVNDITIFTKKEIVSPPNTIEYIEFDAEINEGPSSLQIRLENKNWTDTIQNDTGTEILRDMVLNIESIEIDEIELGNLIFTNGMFFPNNATPGMTAKQELIAYLDFERMKIWEEQLPAAVYDLGGNLIIGDKIEEPIEIDAYLNIDI